MALTFSARKTFEEGRERQEKDEGNGKGGRPAGGFYVVLKLNQTP